MINGHECMERLDHMLLCCSSEKIHLFGNRDAVNRKSVFQRKTRKQEKDKVVEGI